MSEFQIYDAHHHLWRDGTDDRPGGAERYGNKYMDAELVKDIESAGGKCMGTTYLQCFWNGNTVGETAWCQKIADRTNNQVNTAIIGETDMLAPTEQVRAHLKEHMKYPNFRGIRFCISNDSKHRPHTHNFLDLSKGENAFADPQFIANLKPYEELGLSYDVWCYGHQLAGLLVAAKAAPGVNLVIDHFGSPIDVAHDDEGYKAWEATMTELAKLPNVYAKISGLMPVLGFDYRSRREKGDDPTAKEIAASRFGEMVKTTVKLFTPARCMFGSNFPVDGAEASYKELVGAYKISFDELGLTDAEKHAIWYETACRFYRVREFAPK